MRIGIYVEIGALFPEFMLTKCIKCSDKADQLFLTLENSRKLQKYAMLVISVTY